MHTKDKLTDNNSILQVTIRCSFETTDNQTQPFNMMTHYNCSIGNPFSGPGGIRLRVNIEPRDEIIGNENDISINFTVTSINSENQATIADNSNFVVTQLSFEAKAKITIDNGYIRK